MSPKEREHLKKLDEMVLNASPEQLQKIQQVDQHTQLDGHSLYDMYFNSSSLINQSIKKSSKRS